ncbi:MAG: NTP/NDP exchange transporter [Adhaeribacter sp.]
MYNQIISLLNVKPGEISLVKKLFLVQFFLGLATAFLFISSLTLFLSAFEINLLPRVYMLAAFLLLGVNFLYARLEERLAPENLLKVIISLSATSLIIYWVCISFISSPWLSLLLAVWNMVIYMVVGYAFWGMAAVLFNVRESKRLFSIVGAGDIPAKLLGYFSVSVLVPVIGVKNLIWVSVAAFLVTYFLLHKYSHSANFKVNQQHVSQSGPGNHAHGVSAEKSVIKRFFYNQLIFVISLWSLLAYCIFSIIDFTFLAEIKNHYQNEHELATFIGIFFALGRFLAIIIKMVFSSRVIARLGLANALLVTPFLLLLIIAYLFFSEAGLRTHLYTFGGMVLLAEILKSTLQEPVFFILFQPLNPHIRLKGHLIAKGYTLPFALLGVGLFLTIYLQQHAHVSIPYVVQLLAVLLFLWALSVPLIKKEYRDTLVSALKKGYFSETEMFLNDAKVIDTLLQKIKNAKPVEIIHALNLLERANYPKLNLLLLEQLDNPAPEVKEYVLSRIIQNNISEALPLIKKHLEISLDNQVRVSLQKAVFYLNDSLPEDLLVSAQQLDAKSKKAALVGLLQRNETQLNLLVQQELITLANSYQPDDRLLACQVIIETRIDTFSPVLATLLRDDNPAVFNNALEAVGRVKDYSLFPEAFKLAAEKKAYSALAIALLEYGDGIFAARNLPAELPDRNLKELLVKAAGKIKGEHSTRFLLQLLTTGSSKYIDNLLIEALWAKKTKIPDEEARQQIRFWIENKLSQSQLKTFYFKQLAFCKEATLLQTALHSEIKQDLTALLKGLALLYDRSQLDRIIQLYQLGNQHKISNAIEMLELLLPKKYFLQVNNLIELLQDINNGVPVVLPIKASLTADNIVQEILLQNKAGCNAWTKSVALYEVPKLRNQHIPAHVINQEPAPGDVLFRETQQYVLSVLT